MAWETVVLKVQESRKHSRLRDHDWLCPKCDGKVFTIPYPTKSLQAVISQNTTSDEKVYQVLFCDRCGQIMAFEGCTGECASALKSECEICGKYYCHNCGITVDIDVDGKPVELRYCNDHIPEWYKNR